MAPAPPRAGGRRAGSAPAGPKASFAHSPTSRVPLTAQPRVLRPHRARLHWQRNPGPGLGKQPGAHSAATWQGVSYRAWRCVSAQTAAGWAVGGQGRNLAVGAGAQTGFGGFWVESGHLRDQMLTHQGLALGQQWRTPRAEFLPAPRLPHPFSASSHLPQASCVCKGGVAGHGGQGTLSGDSPGF